MEHKIIQPKTYLFVYIALMVFLALTITVAFIHLPGILNLVVAMIIAGIKATLVVLFFMQVRLADQDSRIFAAAGVLWFVILIGLTYVDYVTRFGGYSSLPGH